MPWENTFSGLIQITYKRGILWKLNYMPRKLHFFCEILNAFADVRACVILLL